MDCLFRIETDRVSLAWAPPDGGLSELALAGPLSPPGRLHISPRRTGIIFTGATWRSGVPADAASDWKQLAGPRLFEETAYSIVLTAKGSLPVALLHRDPTVTPDLHPHDDSRTLFGKINFGSQVGTSEFSVLVGGSPEFDFEVELFPAKIDYRSDYEQLTADVQEILTGLVLEYLRATFRFGAGSVVPRSSRLEWTILLRQLMGDLELAIAYITQHPHRALQREPEHVRSEKIRRVDSALRRAISRGRGAGQKQGGPGGELPFRERMPESTAQSTLNTPEHRWMSHQLRWIRRRLSQISVQLGESAKEHPREARIHSEILALQERVAKLSQAPPLREAHGAPPANFASLKLLGGPGYREAYRSILMLALGLRLSGGPVGMSVKDLAVLYEYWCYLAVVRACSDLAEKPVPLHHLIRTEQNGLRVCLQKGKETVIPVDLGAGRTVEVVYNRRFQGKEEFLVPQQPDILLTILDSSWPAVHLVLDAKYRIDGSAQARQTYGSPGPPEDAVNVLHRYRDAIVELEKPESEKPEVEKGSREKTGPVARPRRTVVEAVTLFPYREEESGDFHASRLWKGLDRIGVGAIPFLPESTGYFEEYLQKVLTKGGWSLADRAIVHRSYEHALSWRVAASKIVLVGVLKDDSAEAHLAWIKDKLIYYTPARETQTRQYAVRLLAIYSPASLRKPGPGAVTHVADVLDINTQPRIDIKTPWEPSRDPNEKQVVYKLGAIRELPKPIENLGEGRATRFSQPRWTSFLALERAKSIDELILETEPEWRLYEQLQAGKVAFEVEAGRAGAPDPEDPQGRAWFVVGPTRIQYQGAAGYLLRTQRAPDKYIANPDEVINAVSRK